MAEEIALWVLAVALLCAALVGCVTVPIHAQDEGDRLAIAVAARDLGLRTEYVDTEKGAVKIEIRPEPPGGPLGIGEALPCGGRVESVADTTVLRHELGHALTLQHVDDPGNIMNETSVGSDQALTLKQRRQLRAAVTWLHVCGRRP